MEDNRSRERSGKVITSTRLGKRAEVRVLKLFYMNKETLDIPMVKCARTKTLGGDGNSSGEDSAGSGKL